MLRSFIAIVLASLFLLQSATKLVIVTVYQINKEYIAKNLCENRKKPSMHCNGKCHLRKQLEKEDSKNNRNANDLKEKQSLQFFSRTQICFIFSEPATSKFKTAYNIADYNTSLSRIDHPPRM